MSNIKSYVDDKISRRIIDAISTLDFNTVQVLAKKSGIPVNRLQDFVKGTETITQLDKGKLINHLINLVEITDKNNDVNKTKKYVSLSAHLLSQAE